MRMLPTHEIVNRVMRSQVDLGVLYGPLPDAGVGVTDIAEMDVVCGVNAHSPLAEYKTLTPQLICAERLVSFPVAATWTTRTAAAFEDAHVPYQVAIECGHPTIALSLVECGVGVALLPGPFGDISHFPNVVLRQFSPRVSVRVLAVYRRSRLSRLAAAYMEEMLAYGLKTGLDA